MNEADGGRRERLVKLGSATAFLAIVAVAVLVVISQSGGDGGDAANIEGAAEVRAELRGIPQRGLVLGDPGAKAVLIEFGDLQCPVCKAYSEDIVPQLIESKVRGGEAKLAFRNFAFIGEESVDAAAAALAAGEQGRGWHFVELFYRNQGTEASGYVTDEFMTAIAEGAGVPDIDEWEDAREGDRLRQQVESEIAAADELGLSGTPSFVIEGPLVDGQDVLGTPGDAGSLEDAIEDAA